ncbi:MAG: multiheme c-type cytochrome [Deltaproteobacteria bacterium]
MPLAALSAVAALLLAAPFPSVPKASIRCVECHARSTPGIVSDWKLSRHSEASVGCDSCHGTAHGTAADASKALLPGPDTCARCHATQVAQYKGSKHALAWAAMMAMPTFHYQPPVLTDGLKGCGGCHAIGLREEADQKAIARASGRDYGAGSCDSCHTRHTFSVKEAREPQACKSCHMGFDHAQWEMYDASKHGVRHELVKLGALPATASAPTCQTCHMQKGDHGVMTGWGFLGIRFPLPEDPAWRADQTTILKALGILDPSGKPTTMLEVVKGAKIARMTGPEWQAQRDRMLGTCQQCHSESFSRSQLRRGDQMIREADRLMAEAIEIVAGLYRDGLLQRSKGQRFDYPDVLQFHDSPSVVELKLFTMFMVHRMHAFQGSFHDSPDHALWSGWSEMQKDLAEIRAAAKEMRRAREGKR